MLSILIPAFNERLMLETNIKEVIRVLREIGGEFEIIISEDGSTDGTYNIILALAERYPEVSFLHSDKRLGKGLALRRAWRKAKGEVIAFVDADSPISIRTLPLLIEPIRRGYDLTIGSRYLSGSEVKRSHYKTFKSRFYNWLANLFFHTGISDHQCGFKAFNKHTMEGVVYDVKDTDFFFDTELLVKTKMRGLRILEVPVTWVEPEGRKSRVGFFDEVRLFVAFGCMAFMLYFNKHLGLAMHN